MDIGVSDGVNKETFFKGVEFVKILNLGEMFDLVVVSKKPVIDKGLFHLVDKEGANDTLEVSMIFEVDEEIDLMTAEV